MANFTVFGSTDWSSYDDIVGGRIVLQTAHTFTYISATGFKVVLHGSGFRYDAFGIPTAGTVVDLDVYKAGEHLAAYRSFTTRLTDFCTLALGRTSGAPNTEPDIEALYRDLRDGSDLINGNEFGKAISGYDGDDTIFGNGGDDWLSGGRGIDTYFGGTGLNGVFFDDGEPLDHGVKVNFSLTTGNIVDDGFGNTETATDVQIAEGTSFADRFTGGGGDNAFYGQGGNDTLIGGGGYDSLEGGAGVDAFFGGAGFDQITFYDVPGGGAGVSVNLMNPSASQILNDGFGNAERASGIEDVVGSLGHDTLIGSTVANILWGSDGRDSLTGNGGNDSLYGGNGNDKMFGGTGTDHLVGANGVDTLTGGADVDYFYFLGTAPGSDGADVIADFDAALDGLAINLHWAADLALGLITSAQFRSGAGVTVAATAAQRVIYNTQTGNLYVDADGVGGQAATLIATLTNHAALSWDHVYAVEPF